MTQGGHRNENSRPAWATWQDTVTVIQILESTAEFLPYTSRALNSYPALQDNQRMKPNKKTNLYYKTVSPLWWYTWPAGTWKGIQHALHSLRWLRTSKHKLIHSVNTCIRCTCQSCEDCLREQACGRWEAGVRGLSTAQPTFPRVRKADPGTKALWTEHLRSCVIGLWGLW